MVSRVLKRLGLNSPKMLESVEPVRRYGSRLWRTLPGPAEFEPATRPL